VAILAIEPNFFERPVSKLAPQDAEQEHAKGQEAQPHQGHKSCAARLAGPAVHRGIVGQVVDGHLLVEINFGLYFHRHGHAHVQFLTIFALE
jgi:hypothetical protein